MGAERYRLDRAVATRPQVFVTLSDSIATPGYRDRDLNRSLVYLYRVASLARGQQSPFSDSIAVSLDLPAGLSATPE